MNVVNIYSHYLKYKKELSGLSIRHSTWMEKIEVIVVNYCFMSQKVF